MPSENHVPNEGGNMEKSQITMREALKVYWETHAAQRKSSRSYRAAIIHLNEILGDKLIHEITRIDLLAYRAKREQTAKASTVNREHTVLTHLYNLLKELNRHKVIKVELPEENPGSLVRKTNERQFSRKRVLTSDEFEEILAYLTPDARNICIMGILTTLRRKDLLCLTKDNINVSTKQIEGTQAKTGKPYAIPITPAIKHIIDQAEGHRILNFKNFRRIFEKARSLSGIQHFRFADLRRTGARTMLVKGIDIKTVSEYLGHTDLRMTQAYVPPSLIDFQKAASILSREYCSL